MVDHELVDCGYIGFQIQTILRRDLRQVQACLLENLELFHPQVGGDRVGYLPAERRSHLVGADRPRAERGRQFALDAEIQQQNLIKTILGRRIAQAEKAVLLAGGVEVRHPPSIAKNGDPTSLQLERRVCLSSLRRRTEATKGQHDHAEKGDSRAAVRALVQELGGKGST